MTGGYDEMGPRIDLDHEPDQPSQGRSFPPPPGYEPASARAQVHARPPAKSGGGSAMGMVAVVLAIIALAISGWALFSQPEIVPGPPVSPEVVPGGAAERVAKLEKDVSQLMLRLVTLEKELQSLANKAGTVSQLTELTAKVAALQDRLDALSVEGRVAALSQSRGSTQEAKPAPKAQAKPEPTKPAKPQREKLTYTVRRGDTLFTVARRYKVSMNDLMRWNNIKKGDYLKIGDKLTIYR